MGNITKIDHGKVNHRVIQDLLRNHVNEAARVLERQVLPRGIDHVRDLAWLSRRGGLSEVEVLVLDFKDAFLSIPLHEDERKYNVSVLTGGVRRDRDPVYAGEPESGTCIVWKVLGFGGRPNPLVYSRVASFAMRTAQAICKADKSPAGSAMRSQLYVDDPTVVVWGHSREHRSKLLDTPRDEFKKFSFSAPAPENFLIATVAS